MRTPYHMYNDVIERNQFIDAFNIPILYQPIEYDNLHCKVVNEKQDWDHINKTYEQDSVVIIDNFLYENFVEELRKYTLLTNIRQDLYQDYAALNFHRKQGLLWFKVLSNIVDECKVYMPFLKNYNFDRAWSFIYTNISGGVKMHADPAAVNFNLWVTPEDSMNLSHDHNGLSIWQIRRPIEWEHKDYNENPEKSFEFIKKNNIAPINIPYRYNRVAAFDSSYFHESLPVRTKPGYQNRRINYTFLFS